ncbi:hypothetical protein BH09PAT1_BH09PAT1_3210 [soil metagenome]
MQNIVTVDYSQFGYRELEIAGKLLALYAENGSIFLGSELTVNFNPNSGYVFVLDEDYNVGVFDSSGENIIQFFSCGECGYEATLEDALIDGKDFEKYQGYCSKDCALKYL